jgi:hypothetical protein
MVYGIILFQLASCRCIVPTCQKGEYDGKDWRSQEGFGQYDALRRRALTKRDNQDAAKLAYLDGIKAQSPP